MAKKKRRLNRFKYVNKYNYIIIIFISILSYLRLFFVGEYIDISLYYLLGRTELLYLTLIIYCLHKFFDSKYIKKIEIIGMFGLYISISLIANMGIVYQNFNNLLFVIITENITTLITYFSLIISITMIFSRYKEVIKKELNLGVKVTNSKINDFKKKTFEEKKSEFVNYKNEENYSYINKYLELTNVSSDSIVNKVRTRQINNYVDSIDSYISNIVSAVTGIFSSYQVNSKVIKQIIDMEHITIKFLTLNSISNRQILSEINNKIINSEIDYNSEIWTIRVSYISDSLISIKNLVTTYKDNGQLSFGITKFGNYFNSDSNSNIFINYENKNTLNLFMRNLYVIKSICKEDFILIDFSKSIFQDIISKENFDYDCISDSNDLNSLLEMLLETMSQREEYAYDLGYSSVDNYVKSKNIKFRKINIVFNEIGSIPISSDSELYNKLIKIMTTSSLHCFNFIITNSVADNDILSSELYNKCEEKLFFETYSNSFSKLLIGNKLLSEINGDPVFYFKSDDNFKKVYIPTDVENTNTYIDIISESLEKKKIDSNDFKYNSIYNELLSMNMNNELITSTYIISKYGIDYKEAENILRKIKGVR